MVAGIAGEGGRQAADILRRQGLASFGGMPTPQFFQKAYPEAPHPLRVLIPEVVFRLMAVVALTEGAPMVRAVGLLRRHVHPVVPALPLRPVTDAAFCIARRASTGWTSICRIRPGCTMSALAPRASTGRGSAREPRWWGWSACTRGSVATSVWSR